MKYLASIIILLLIFLLLMPGQIMGQEEDSPEGTEEVEEGTEAEAEEETTEETESEDESEEEQIGGSGSDSKMISQLGYRYSFDERETVDKTSLTQPEKTSQQTKISGISASWSIGNFTTSGNVNQTFFQRDSSNINLNIDSSSYALAAQYKTESWLFIVTNLASQRNFKSATSVLPTIEQKTNFDGSYEAQAGYGLFGWFLSVGTGHAKQKVNLKFGGSQVADESYEFDYNLYRISKEAGDEEGFFFSLDFTSKAFPAVSGKQVNLNSSQPYSASYSIGYTDLATFSQEENLNMDTFKGLSSYERFSKSTSLSIQITEQLTISISETNIEEKDALTPQTNFTIVSKSRQKATGLGVSFLFGDL